MRMIITRFGLHWWIWIASVGGSGPRGRCLILTFAQYLCIANLSIGGEHWLVEQAEGQGLLQLMV